MRAAGAVCSEGGAHPFTRPPQPPQLPNPPNDLGFGEVVGRGAHTASNRTHQTSPFHPTHPATCAPPPTRQDRVPSTRSLAERARCPATLTHHIPHAHAGAVLQSARTCVSVSVSRTASDERREAHNPTPPCTARPSQRCDVYDPSTHDGAGVCRAHAHGTFGTRGGRAPSLPRGFRVMWRGVEKPALIGGVLCGVLSSKGDGWADERGARSPRG